MSPRLPRLIPCLLLPLLAACGGGDATAPEPVDLSGVYLLVTLGGEELPYLADQELDTTLEVVGGTVTLRADGTFRDEVDLRITTAGVPEDIQQKAVGTWAVEGEVVTFTPTTVPVYTMTVAGATLTQDVDGFIWVYRKE